MMLRTVLQIIAISVPTYVGITPLDTARAQERDKEGRKPVAQSEPANSPPRGGVSPAGHKEVPDDVFIPVPRAGRATTPAVRWTRNGYVSVQVNIDAEGNNIVGDAANEPSIAVDPTNPARMAIGWRQFDTITSNFRQAGWGYTADGGFSWTFPGVIEPGVFRSDPVLGANTQGEFFYNSLTSSGGNFWCNVFKSTDGGASWDSGVYAYGGDKLWMTVDLTDGIGQDNIYAYWRSYWTCSGCAGHFTRSYDRGQTFLPTIYVLGNPHTGTLAVGPDGELYIAGDSFCGFVVAKSSTMHDEALPPQFDFSGTVDLDGNMVGHGGPNPGGLLGQAWIAVDHSDGPSRGYAYLLCSVQRSSTSDPLDVMFSRGIASDLLGGLLRWSTPVRVNDDPQGNDAYQWFGTMSVAPNGRIDVIWNDTRNDPGGYDSELYYSYSTDTGVTWSTNEPLSPPFDPHLGWPQQIKIGDYYDMVSDNVGASLAYAATFNGEQDIYYLRIGPAYCDDAGTIELDRAKYLCEATAKIVVLDCALNADDNAVEYVTVDIDSTSEIGVEEVILTEVAPAVAMFQGSISVSTMDSPGVLLVADGDTITAAYLDADDGQGGMNVVVTDAAVVDCTPPLISNVQTSSIEIGSAVITFDTDEPATGVVRYGLVCGALVDTASAAGFDTSHLVNLFELVRNTTYFYAVDCMDEIGNGATDDNGGACYTFATPDIPDYFTESFSPGEYDLGYYSVSFLPNESRDYYRTCTEAIEGFPIDPAGGTTILPGGYGYTTVNLSGGAAVFLYGTDYDAFYVGGNGYITFTAGDGDYTQSLADHFDLPRISALFNDFMPQSGTVSWQQFSDRAVVTYENVPTSYNGGSNNFQVEMRFDGTIVISYLGVTASDGIAGLSRGAGLPGDFVETDLSTGKTCTAHPPTDAPAPHNARRNRYISFDPNNLESVALHVELTAGPGSAGALGWVGEPSVDGVSRVVSEAYFTSSWPAVLDVADCEIVPVATYAIRATTDGVGFSDPLEIGTIHKPGDKYYGDTVGDGTGDLPPLPGFTPPNGNVNVTDVQAFILTIQGVSSPSAHITWVDLHGLGVGTPPNYLLNTSDLQRILFGMDGQQYMDAPDQLDPSDCP